MAVMQRITCDCRPGTYEDGWREERCPECLEFEIQLWREMIERWETEGGRHERALGT